MALADMFGMGGMDENMQKAVMAQALMGGLSGALKGSLPTTNVAARSPLYGLANTMEGLQGGLSGGMGMAQALQSMAEKKKQADLLNQIIEMLKGGGITPKEVGLSLPMGGAGGRAPQLPSFNMTGEPSIPQTYMQTPMFPSIR